VRQLEELEAEVVWMQQEMRGLLVHSQAQQLRWIDQQRRAEAEERERERGEGARGGGRPSPCLCSAGQPQSALITVSAGTSSKAQGLVLVSGLVKGFVLVTGLALVTGFAIVTGRTLVPGFAIVTGLYLPWRVLVGLFRTTLKDQIQHVASKMARRVENDQVSQRACSLKGSAAARRASECTYQLRAQFFTK